MKIEVIDKEVFNCLVDPSNIKSYMYDKTKEYDYIQKVMQKTKKFVKKNISYKEMEKLNNKIQKVYDDYYYQDNKNYLITNLSKLILVVSYISEQPTFNNDIYLKLMYGGIDLCYQYPNTKEYFDKLCELCKTLNHDISESTIVEYIKKLEEIRNEKQAKMFKKDKLMKHFKKMFAKLKNSGNMGDLQKLLGGL